MNCSKVESMYIMRGEIVNGSSIFLELRQTAHSLHKMQYTFYSEDTNTTMANMNTVVGMYTAAAGQ